MFESQKNFAKHDGDKPIVPIFCILRRKDLFLTGFLRTFARNLYINKVNKHGISNKIQPR